MNDAGVGEDSDLANWAAGRQRVCSAFCVHRHTLSGYTLVLNAPSS